MRTLQDSSLGLGPRWLRAISLCLFCCSLGALVALSLQRAGHRVPVEWAIAVCLLPSLIAGWIWARQRRQSAVDPHTGFPGEHALREALAAEFARARRSGKKVGLVVVELAQDEGLGLTLGRQWQTAAGLLKQTLRAYDTCYVLEPGRFTVMLAETAGEGGAAVVARIRQALSASPDLQEVEVSFGTVVMDPSAEGAEPGDLLQNALKKVQVVGEGLLTVAKI